MNAAADPCHVVVGAGVPTDKLRRILDHAKELKNQRRQGMVNHALMGKKLAMIFEKNSTRTRVSFEVGMQELGGYVQTCSPTKKAAAPSRAKLSHG